jgi:hypothetical protein
LDRSSSELIHLDAALANRRSGETVSDLDRYIVLIHYCDFVVNAFIHSFEGMYCCGLVREGLQMIVCEVY